MTSLHSAGGGYTNTCAASYGERVVLFELQPHAAAGAVVNAAKRSWVAHKGSTTSCLAPGASMRSLLSGGADGSIHM